MMGHGANLLLLMAGGDPGVPPLITADQPPAAAADPLPQALALTAIVITFGVIAFLLALAYRSWVVTHDDTVEDDVEDRRIAARDVEDRRIAARDEEDRRIAARDEEARR